MKGFTERFCQLCSRARERARFRHISVLAFKGARKGFTEEWLIELKSLEQNCPLLTTFDDIILQLLDLIEGAVHLFDLPD